MAGLLDNPKDAAMLQLGLGLLSRSGPSRTPVSIGQALGDAGQEAMGTYRQAQQEQQANLMRDLQMQDLLQKQVAQKQKQEGLAKLMTDPTIPQHIKAGVAAGVVDLGDLYKPQKLGEGDTLVSPIQSMMGGNGVLMSGSPKAKKPPVIKDFISGDSVIQKQFDESTGTWKPLGMGPRFSSQVASVAGNKPPPGYRYTPMGDLEAIPGGPADAKQQAADKKIADGSADVAVALSSLRDAYDRLQSGGGITSTKESGLSNLMASSSSSGLGQALGKAFGTANQSARNDIAMARPALLAALMRATGMSAKQMDSNAELKLWLSTATDPTLDVEANRKALDNIERKYIKPTQQAPSSQAGRAQSRVPSGGGVKFLGFE